MVLVATCRADTRNVRTWLPLVLAVSAAGCASAGAVTTPAAFPGVRPPATLRPAPTTPRTPFVTAATVKDTALSYRGVPYRFGGTDPASGFDCSGFIHYVLAKHQLDVPRTTSEQFRLGQRVKREDIRPGDLVFFSTIAPGASHVGLAISATEFVHAPATSGVVRVESLQSTYWRPRFVGARRLFSE